MFIGAITATFVGYHMPPKDSNAVSSNTEIRFCTSQTHFTLRNNIENIYVRKTDGNNIEVKKSENQPFHQGDTIWKNRNEGYKMYWAQFGASDLWCFRLIPESPENETDFIDPW